MAGVEAGLDTAEFESASSSDEVVHAKVATGPKGVEYGRVYEGLREGLGRAPTRREFAAAAGVSRQRIHQIRGRFELSRCSPGAEARERLRVAAGELAARGLTITTRRLSEVSGVNLHFVRKNARSCGIEVVLSWRPERREILTAKHKELMLSLARLPTVTEFVEAVWGPGANSGRVSQARQIGLEFFKGRR